MASILDIENAIVDLIAPTEPTGYDCLYYAGWPKPEELEGDLRANTHHITVYPFGSGKKMDRPLSRGSVKILDNPDGKSAQAITEIYRQSRNMMITVWANSPIGRDVISEAIRAVLDITGYLTFPDTTSGRIYWADEQDDDSQEKANIYRRTLFYTVEYSTTRQDKYYKACLPRIVNAAGDVVSLGNDKSVLVNTDIT